MARLTTANSVCASPASIHDNIAFRNSEVNLRDDIAGRLQDILRVTAYHRKDLDPAVIFPESHVCNRALSTAFRAFDTPVQSTLGLFDLLPLETLQEICLCLDLLSALSFSHVNRSARMVIASIKKYQRVREHAKSALHGVFRSNLASRTDIDSLHAALCNRNARCLSCNHFSNFLHLPFMQRCCAVCLNSSPLLQNIFIGYISTGYFPKPIDKQPAQEIFEKLQLPVLRSFAWHDKDNETRKAANTYFGFNFHEIVNMMHVKAVIRRTEYNRFKPYHPSSHTGSPQSDEIPADIALKRPISNAEIFNTLFYPGAESVKYHLLSPNCGYGDIYTAALFSATFLPYLDPTTEEIDLGYSCRGCDSLPRNLPFGREWPEIIPPPDPIYSRAEFLEHVLDCEHAQKLWVQAQKRTSLAQV